MAAGRRMCSCGTSSGHWTDHHVPFSLGFMLYEEATSIFFLFSQFFIVSVGSICIMFLNTTLVQLRTWEWSPELRDAGSPIPVRSRCEGTSFTIKHYESWLELFRVSYGPYWDSFRKLDFLRRLLPLKLLLNCDYYNCYYFCCYHQNNYCCYWFC